MFPGTVVSGGVGVALQLDMTVGSEVGSEVHCVFHKCVGSTASLSADGFRYDRDPRT